MAEARETCARRAVFRRGMRDTERTDGIAQRRLARHATLEVYLIRRGALWCRRGQAHLATASPNRRRKPA